MVFNVRSDMVQVGEAGGMEDSVEVKVLGD